MAQAVSRWPVIAEALFQSRVSPCGICDGQSGTGTGFFPEYFGFPSSISFHRCSITWKNEKQLIIFITGLHNNPQVFITRLIFFCVFYCLESKRFKLQIQVN
jgi:hypothetical protein